MSNANLLTWDNMEEFIASLPKDDKGHFLPNPGKFEKKELTLSVERDSWTSGEVDLLAPIEKAREKIASDKLNVALLELEKIKDKMIDVLVDDGFIFDRDKWLSQCKVEYLSNLFVLNTTSGVLAEIHSQPTNKPNESLLKNGQSKFYLLCLIKETKPEPVMGEKPLPMGKNYNEALTDDVEVISLGFGGGKGIVQMGAALIANRMRSEGSTELAELTEKAFNIPQTPGVDPLLRAQQGLANLDTTEAEQELAQQAEALERTKQLKESGLLDIVNSPLTNPNMTPAELKAWTEANVEKAKASIIGVDKLITYAGRLNVKDKFLMNCPADLNQLIPFKYNWAWSFYLTSSANHWMPGESNLYSIINEYKGTNDSIKKLVARAWFTHQAKLGLFGEGILVNLYRQITNPESRQYLLRQGQEFIVVRHAWMEINDFLNVKEMLIGGLTPAKSLAIDEDTFNRRTLATRKHIHHLRDLTSTTETTEKLASFLKSFIIGYTCTNWLSPLVSYYQVITALEFNETCQPLAHIFMNLIRDNISQFEFAKLFIAGVIEENPAIVSPSWCEDILATINELISYEIKLTQTLTAGENDMDDVMFICNNYRDEVMSIVDPTYQRVQPTGEYTRGYEFVQLIKNLSPEVDHNAGLGAVQW